MNGHMMSFGNWGTGMDGVMGWGLHGFGMILFWGLLLALTFWLARWFFGPGAQALNTGAGAKGTESAVDLLKARYARGEISREEYQAIRTDLEKG